MRSFENSEQLTEAREAIAVIPMTEATKVGDIVTDSKGTRWRLKEVVNVADITKHLDLYSRAAPCASVWIETVRMRFERA